MAQLVGNSVGGLPRCIMRFAGHALHRAQIDTRHDHVFGTLTVKFEHMDSRPDAGSLPAARGMLKRLE